MAINAAWAWITAMSGLLAIGYALLVRRLNDHPRYGAFWRDHAWVEVAAGCSLIAASVGWVGGWQVGALVFGGCVVWGTPMIVGELEAHARREAERDEQRIAEGG